ncbi:MarR family winged helix-turn-helix transcriptional regulator [Streptomyces sp. NBC_00237]|uniref:MarR family winged helix-turn-helix transcriptional regulator n=1 Tax=Streptomyces sp. NBC_00237 TaxID=2975687 RepID=UPI002252739E|nr:MarR family winged helix-turn-helix transcriptional regulator [Streptomyces sp. NBC_00237]MCX5204135.1 MarR family winged helix-turn-helix transcriptional regulator [Streptomyces sp. NBC_00237]
MTTTTTTTSTARVPATPQHTANPQAADADLASQPVAYWTGVASHAVKNLLRDSMARYDVTQPQWWVLNRVDATPTRAEVIAVLADVAETRYDVPRVIDQLLHRGWLAADADDRLSLTESGRAGRAEIKQLVTGLRAQVHEGVTDEEYVAALKVLRRMTANARQSTQPWQ